MPRSFSHFLFSQEAFSPDLARFRYKSLPGAFTTIEAFTRTITAFGTSKIFSGGAGRGSPLACRCVDWFYVRNFWTGRIRFISADIHSPHMVKQRGVLSLNKNSNVESMNKTLCVLHITPFFIPRRNPAL